MKVRSAPLADATLGLLYMATGVVVSVIAFGQAQSFDTFALVFAAVTFGAVIALVAFSVRQVRRAQTLTEPVALAPWYAVVARAVLTVAVPLASIVFVSTLTGRVAWILGPECLILGAGMCGIAALAGRGDLRVVKADNGYYLVPQTHMPAL